MLHSAASVLKIWTLWSEFLRTFFNKAKIYFLINLNMFLIGKEYFFQKGTGNVNWYNHCGEQYVGSLRK